MDKMTREELIERIISGKGNDLTLLRRVKREVSKLSTSSLKSYNRHARKVPVAKRIWDKRRMDVQVRNAKKILLGK
jgi:hypothetical protein